MDKFSILVVEDSSSDADLLYQNFLKAGKKNWSLTIVDRLSEGIAKAQTNNFDLALLDLSLPDSDGIETVESFINAVPNVPAMVLTIASDEKLALTAINRGAQDYLIKGEITPTLLVRAVHYSIERGQLMRQLVRSNADLEAFNFSMAHDLQAPLRTIITLNQVVIEDYGDRLDDTAQDYLQRSITAASNLNTLIKELLVYSRMGCKEIELHKVDLADVVFQVIKDLESSIAEVEAEVDIEKCTGVVEGHQSILIQAIQNLITNAIKFVPANTPPKIRIWTEKRHKWIRLWVEDNGIGISAQDLDKIFDIFIRLHGNKSYPGTGVGLAFVKRGIERLNGRVGVESEVGRGSKFWIELPKADLTLSNEQ